jgi:succinoglycan biosynthesis transport protein ExoP
MPEEFEESTAQQFEIGRYLDIVRRRHIPFLILLLLGWAAVWGSSWVLPARYKSSTLILVEQPAMPKDYVVPNVSDNLQDRLQSITQQILSRTRLLLIIDKLHLYQGKNQESTPDERVEKMRKDIEIELVRDEKNQSITAFRINYSAPDPRTAQQVTSELMNLFIDENLKVREQQSENTTQFLQTQLASARANLADQEGKVRAFEAAHQGELPTEQATNLQILSGLQAQLQNEQDSLNTAKEQSGYHQSLADQYHTLEGKHRSASGAPVGLEAIDDQLDKLRSKLQELQTRYTDQYPEVQQVKAEIAEAEKAREKQVASLKNEADGKEHNAGGQPKAIEDPAQSAMLVQLQGQEQADKVEIANREQAITALKSRIEQYQARLSAEPAVGQQLAELTRGYEQSQVDYNALLKKESDSKMATSMEEMQQGERFNMLDPPSLPQRPDFPDRLKMCGMGFAVGLGLGALGVILLEFLGGRMYSEREIEKLIRVAVIAEIPEILDSSDTKRKKWRAALGWAMATLVLGAILSGSAFSYLHN